MEESKPDESNRPVAKLLSVAISLRIISDTGVQLFFPFLPVLAAGIGVSVGTMGRLLAIRTLMGLVAPFLGELADKRGYRAVMHGGLLALGSGLILFALSPNVPVAILSLVIMGLGINAFVPNLLAYVSAQIPFNIRSRGLGMLELSWAFAGIVGVFLIGQGITLFGWRATVITLGTLTIVASFILRTLPGTNRHQTANNSQKWAGFGNWFRTYFSWGQYARSAWAVHLASFTTAFAGFHLFGAYGEWLFSDFSFAASQLGFIALLLGLSDLASNSLITIFGDRMGALRALKIGAPMAAALALGHLWFGSSLFLLVGGLLMMRFFTEFVFVNGLIVATGQLPHQRGKMMTINSAFGTLGIALANVTGPDFFVRFGPAGLAIPTFAGYAIATLLFYLLVNENAALERINDD